MPVHARWGAYLFLLFLAACASSPAKKKPVENSQEVSAPVPAAPPAPVAPSPPAENVAEEESPDSEAEHAEVEASSTLSNAISDWISSHPEADLEEAARMANRLMRRHGYPLVLDVSPSVKPKQNTFRLRSGRRKFIFRAGKELSQTADVCGERFLRVPGRFHGPGKVSIVQGGRDYPISLKGIKRERFRVLKRGKQVSVLFAPEPTEPIGIAGNGKAIFTRFPLNEELTGEWWQRIARDQPSVLDEIPYLVLRVEKGRLYFDENIEHIPAQEFEVEKNEGANFRWRFQPSGLVLELNSNCG